RAAARDGRLFDGEVRGSQASRGGPHPGEGVPPRTREGGRDADRDVGQDVRSALPRRGGDGAGRDAARRGASRLADRRQGPAGSLGEAGEAEGVAGNRGARGRFHFRELLRAPAPGFWLPVTGYGLVLTVR